MSPHLSELRKYIEDGDEDAFRTVVSHYIGLVYGTARRQLNGMVKYCDSAYGVAEGVDALIVATGWPEFRNIKRATSQVRPWLAVTSPP